MKFEISKDNADVTSILLIIAGIVGIVSFFVAWANGWTGMQFFENAYVLNENPVMDKWKCYIPLFVAVLSALTVVIGILVLVGVNLNERIVAGEYIVFGIIGLVAIIVFGTTNVEGVQIFSKAEIGLWLAMIETIVVLVIGLLQANNIRKA